MASPHLSRSQTLFYFTIPFIVIDIIIFTLYIYKLYIPRPDAQRKQRKVSVLQKRLHNVCLLSITLSSICDAMHGYGAMRTDTALMQDTILWVKIFHIFADVFYYIGSIVLYIILLHRLFSTFSQSAYAISHYFLYWITLQITLQIIFMILYLCVVIFDDCADKLGCKMLGIMASAVMFNDYILNIVSFVLFIWKLRQLVIIKLESELLQFVDSNLSLNTGLMNDALDVNANNKLLELITKQTVIGVFVIMVNQAFATCIFIMFTFHSQSKAQAMVMVAYLSRGAEGSVICFLLYLALAINDSQYRKVCKLCHAACYNLCIAVTKKSVKRDIRINDTYTALPDNT